jgi:hypothetical protein
MAQHLCRWSSAREASIDGWAGLGGGLVGYLIGVANVVERIKEGSASVERRHRLDLVGLRNSGSNAHLVVGLRSVDGRVGLLLNYLLQLTHPLRVVGLPQLLRPALASLFFRKGSRVRAQLLLVALFQNGLLQDIFNGGPF